MIVTCEFNVQGKQCKYYESGYCAAKAINITKEGTCGHVIRQNKLDITAFNTIEEEYKEANAVPLSEEEYAALAQDCVIEEQKEPHTLKTRRRAIRPLRRIARPAQLK